MLTVFCTVLLLSTPTNLEKVSESLGHLIGKHIENLDLPLDLNALAKGIEAERMGNDAPLNEEECLEAIASLQEKKQEELAKKNLEEAEKYLAANCSSLTPKRYWRES